jgi:hypothetical protein
MDGKFQGDGSCQTKQDKYPWLALDFGERVEVTSVTLYNNDKEGERLQAVDVRVTDTLPPDTWPSDHPNWYFPGQTYWPYGIMLGMFAGPGTNGQVITLSTSDDSFQGPSNPKGRYNLASENTCLIIF